MPLEVHKFGGTSVKNAERMQSVTALLASVASQADLVVVSSAMAGVTNGLLALANTAVSTLEGTVQAVDAIRERHQMAVQELELADRKDVAELNEQIHALCDELLSLIQAARVLGGLNLRNSDRVQVVGEKLAVRLLAASLRNAGISAVAMDADTFLVTNDQFGQAAPIPVLTERSIQSALQPVLEQGIIPVVTGFCGRSSDGATTTLGRGGSDLTATLLGAALEAHEVTIWTDVDGVYTANPTWVPDAMPLPQLHYREAAELSYYGAKVLHQRTMIPVVQQRIPVRTRNSYRPEQPGTRIDGHYTPGSHPVKAISAVTNHSLIALEGKGMAGVPGIAGLTFTTLADANISVTMISQSSSESSICFAVPGEQAGQAAQRLKQVFRQHLARGDIEEITTVNSVSLIAAVGLGMAASPGIAARVCAALGTKQINILAIAQGSSELNISLAVPEGRTREALRAIHYEFGLHGIDTGNDNPDRMDLIVLGCGRVGRAFIGLVHDRAAAVRQRFGLSLNIVGVSDRSGFLWDEAGLSRNRLEGLVAHKDRGTPLMSCDESARMGTPLDLVHTAARFRLRRPVIVDVSDASSSQEPFLFALQNGMDVVTANKKPLADDFDAWSGITQAISAHGRILRAEATVGAGLPVVDTLDVLLSAGDKLHRAEGCLSGTLGFLMDGLGRDRLFSELVREAMELGYTEPDPYADLSGVDVARKAAILGRLSGLAPNVKIQCTGLVDPSFEGLPHADLFARLKEMDAGMREAVHHARDQGCVLRYAATIAPTSIEVGLKAVARESALGGLQGTDNMIVFWSERYNERPLVVSGPGAGVPVTAMGVFGDLMRVAAERK